MRNMAGGPAAARGPGHYAADRRWWWDERQQRWFRVVGRQLAEIVADERGDRPWATALVSAFVPYGDVYVRFAVRERAPATGRNSLWSPRPLYVGTPFPAARAALDDVAAQGVWRAIQVARLAELQAVLVADGWEPAGRGQHWWSARYSRPRIDPLTPHDAYERAAANPAAEAGQIPGRRRPRIPPESRRPGLGRRVPGSAASRRGDR
jgi:hypothetical protein